MGLAPVENLKGFAVNRPPLVVFMVCVTALAIILLSVAYYVKLNEVRNPDITQDWNVFLENFADLEFCITGMGNQTDISPTVLAPPSKQTRQLTKRRRPHHKKPMHHSSGVLQYEPSRNYSVSLLLTISPTQEFLRIHHNVTHISGTILGNQLGLKGSAAEEPINITAQLPYDWNSTRCSTSLGCDLVQIFACVTFLASPHVFPSSRNPQLCYDVNETGIDYHAKIEAYKPKSTYATYWCRQKPTIKVQYKFNPTLTVWLSLHEKSVINLHLLHTSYFLFVMVVTLLCYAIIRGKPTKIKVIQVSTMGPT